MINTIHFIQHIASFSRRDTQMHDISQWMPEFKVSAESDVDLMRYFVKTPLLDRLLRGDRWMVIGRKGTGKTAIYEFLRQASAPEIQDYRTIPLSFKEYPWPIQKLYREAMESEISSYQKSWRYIIIVKAIANLIDILEIQSALPPELKKAKALINQIYNSPNPNLLEIIKSKVFRLQSFKLPSGEIGKASFSLGEIEFEDVAASEDLQRKLRANAFNLLDYFEGLLKKHVAKSKQLIVIDQLDEAWLQGETKEYSKILVNLILCAQSINNSTTYRGSLKVLVFLRADIYEMLQFNDKNKVFQDGAVEITWDYPSIESMVTERIQKYAPKGAKLELSQRSGSIFENKTVRHGATPLKHMLRRSFYRPRDIIVFFNKIKEIHKPSASGLYTSRDLYNAERPASQSLYNELKDEWSAQLPDFEKYLLAIQNIGYEIFTTKQYYDKYKLLNSKATTSEANEVLRFLFVNSIIGQKVSVNWEYVCTNPHIQIDFTRPFHVNIGLKFRLVLTENREKRVKKSPKN
jgi:hypothetical protein